MSHTVWWSQGVRDGSVDAGSYEADGRDDAVRKHALAIHQFGRSKFFVEHEGRITSHYVTTLGGPGIGSKAKPRPARVQFIREEP